VLGRLDDHVSDRVEPCSPSTAGDLLELPHLELSLTCPVILRQTAEQDCADGHVDPDAQGVGAAHHLEQSLLGQCLDEAAIARQHPRMVHADTHSDESRQGLAEGRREPEVADRFGDDVAFGARCHLDAGERLGTVQRRELREVDDIHRCLARLDELLEGFLHG